MKNALRIRTFLGPVALVFASAATLLTGCAGFTSAPSATGPTGSLHLKGTVHGGQQPISGAKVYLYYTGFTNGGASQSLLTTTGGYVTTDANGSFSITGDYTCPSFSVSPSTYLLATGGNPGLASGTNNTAIALIAAVGPCSGLSASTDVVVNELTTVAAVTALQQFTVDATHIGASSLSSQPSYSQVLNTQNATLVASNLVDTSTGVTVPSIGASGGIPTQAKVNTLGNILASCVNSASSTSTPCAHLFAAATPTGGTAPTNTVVAMLNIAKNPGTNVATLFALPAATAPFQPSLGTAPNDFALSITYTGGGLSAPGPLAVDNAGDVWIANCPSCSSVTGTDSVVAFEPNGAIITTPTTYKTNVHKPVSIAIDRYNGVWVLEAASGTLGNQVTRLSNTDGTLNGANFPVTLTGAPSALGIALVENSPSAAFITDSTNGRLQAINSDGTVIGGINTTTAGLTEPTAIVEDGLQNLFLIGTGTSTIVKYTGVYGDFSNSSPNESVVTTGTLSGFSAAPAGFSSPVSLAVDENNHLWTYDSKTQAVSEAFGFNESAISPNTGYTGTGVTDAQQVTLDGIGSVWLGNCRVDCSAISASTSPDNIVHLTAAGTSALASDGLQDSHLDNPTYSVVDMSGNLWVSNTTGGSVTEFVGVAAPVVTEQETASSKNALPVTKQYLLNPSFELGSTGSNPPDWTYSSTAGNKASIANTDTGAFSGQQKLTFYDGAMEAVNATESQTITGMPSGEYLVTCYAGGYFGGSSDTSSVTAVTSGTTYTAPSYSGTASSPTGIINYDFAPLSVLVHVTSGTMTVNLNAVDSYAGGGVYVGFDACSVTEE